MSAQYLWRLSSIGVLMGSGHRGKLEWLCVVRALPDRDLSSPAEIWKAKDHAGGAGVRDKGGCCGWLTLAKRGAGTGGAAGNITREARALFAKLWRPRFSLLFLSPGLWVIISLSVEIAVSFIAGGSHLPCCEIRVFVKTGFLPRPGGCNIFVGSVVLAFYK